MTDLEKLEVLEAIERITELLVALVRSDWDCDIERNDQGMMELNKSEEVKLLLN